MKTITMKFPEGGRAVYIVKNASARPRTQPQPLRQTPYNDCYYFAESEIYEIASWGGYYYIDAETLIVTLYDGVRTIPVECEVRIV